MQQLTENLGYSIRSETSSIIGLTDLLLKTSLTAEQREYLLDIKNSSNAILLNISGEPSQPEKGSEQERQTEPPPAASSLGASSTKSLMVLVAEDSRVSGTIITKMLQALGHKVDIAENGQTTIAALQNKRYDFVLMDCQMPVLDGIEATKAIRNQESGVKDPSIPIIALTARATAGDRQECMDAGMDAYISKPVNIQTLEAIIIRFFSN